MTAIPTNTQEAEARIRGEAFSQVLTDTIKITGDTSIQSDLNRIDQEYLALARAIQNADKFDKVNERLKKAESAFYAKDSFQQKLLKKLNKWNAIRHEFNMACAEVDDLFTERTDRRIEQIKKKLIVDIVDPEIKSLLTEPEIDTKTGNLAIIISASGKAATDCLLKESKRGMRKWRWKYFFGTGLQGILHNSLEVVLSFCVLTLLFGYITKVIVGIGWPIWAVGAITFLAWYCKKYWIQPKVEKYLFEWRRKILLGACSKLLVAERFMRLAESYTEFSWENHRKSKIDGLNK